MVYALYKPHMRAIEVLLKAGADSNVQYYDLDYYKDQEQHLEKIASYTRTSDIISNFRYHGYTHYDRTLAPHSPIVTAVGTQNVELIRCLVGHGARFGLSRTHRDPPGVRSDFTWLSGELAFLPSNLWQEIMSLVLEVEGCLNTRMIRSIFTREDHRMLRLVMERSIPVVDDSGRCVKDCNWMLNLAASNFQNLSNFSRLLERRSLYNLDLNKSRTTPEITPLQSACTSCKDPGIVELLLAHGANPDEISICANQEQTPLFLSVGRMCSWRKSMHMVVILIKHNCNLDIKCPLVVMPQGFDVRYDISAFEYALISSNLCAAMLLRSAGASVNRPSEWYHQMQENLKNRLEITPTALRGSDDEWNSFLSDIYSPPSLELMCRNTIRRSPRGLGKGREAEAKISQLQYPQIGKDFLNYSDLDIITSRFARSDEK